MRKNVTKAQQYANEHAEIDPGVIEIYSIKSKRGLVRLLEINKLLGERNVIESVDFGTDTKDGLSIVDITPNQFSLVKKGKLKLPKGWTLTGSKLLYKR